MRRTYSVTLIKSTVPRLSNAVRSSQRSAKFYRSRVCFASQLAALPRLEFCCAEKSSYANHRGINYHAVYAPPVPAHDLKFSAICSAMRARASWLYIRVA